MRKVGNGGGWAAIGYSIRKARQAGGLWKFYKALRSKNACKTCALGMGGQKGGMVNERGAFPEVCKKSMQAMASDMQPAITAEFWQQNSVAELQSWSSRQLEISGRLIQPVLYTRGASHFRPVTWREAMQRIEDALKSLAPDQTFWYFSGRSSNEAGFLLQLVARLYGTNNVNNCSYYCHQASGVGLNKALGTGTATVTLEDIEHCDLAFIIGGNPASNHPRLLTSLTHLRRRGGQVILINPVRELGMVKFRIPSDVRSMLFGSSIASHYCQPHIGGDLALLTGIAKAVVQCGAADEAFIANHTSGGANFVQHLQGLRWSDLEQRSGVTQAEMRRIAELYAQSRAAIFGWTMGITHHVHGVENVEAIVNLALLRGMVGRSGAGLMPIRGHSNVQGMGSVGVTPKLKDAIFNNLQQHYQLPLPTSPGMDTMACMEAAHSGQTQAAICLGGNLYGSNPDAAYAKQALGQLRLLATLSTTLNTGHVHALADQTLILPVLPRDEEPQPTTQESMFNFVRLSDGGPVRYPGPRSEIQVVAELGQRLVGDSAAIQWTDMQQSDTIRQWIGQVVPGYQAIGSIGQTKQEFQITGRILHQPRFSTPDGRAIFHSHPIPELAAIGVDQLRLMTVRSEGQFNTVVYEEEDLYRGQERRDLILIHPDDLRRLNLQPDQPVEITSSVGRIAGYLARSYDDIRPGNALMYYPEANVLVPRTLDPQSKTPAFKCVIVTVKPATAAPLNR
ncbi:MAG: FdhF/YdeP family oxidoreductase [Pirellulaceae bacterium]|nr:FdhF/YdeP family oxidoreductase [Pirellulaceae bacterium]